MINFYLRLLPIFAMREASLLKIFESSVKEFFNLYKLLQNQFKEN